MFWRVPLPTPKTTFSEIHPNTLILTVFSDPADLKSPAKRPDGITPENSTDIKPVCQNTGGNDGRYRPPMPFRKRIIYPHIAGHFCGKPLPECQYERILKNTVGKNDDEKNYTSPVIKKLP